MLGASWRNAMRLMGPFRVEFEESWQSLLCGLGPIHQAEGFAPIGVWGGFRCSLTKVWNCFESDECILLYRHLYVSRWWFIGSLSSRSANHKIPRANIKFYHIAADILRQAMSKGFTARLAGRWFLLIPCLWVWSVGTRLGLSLGIIWNIKK